MKRLWISGCLALATVLGWAMPSQAADYRIGKEDVLSVSVWLHPELERTVTVSSDGKIVFPPLGELQAEGVTPKDLGERIAERLGSYLRQSSQVTVTVMQYNSNSVYVNGAVSRPGRYGFEKIPGLAEVIGSAGGATAGADLSHVQIFRREGNVRRTLMADVASFLRDGRPALPELKAGDTIVISATVGPGGTGGGIGVGGEVVAVLGEVQKPGLYGVGPGQDLLMVLAQAGGTTPNANLSRVRIVVRSPGSESQTVFNVNLQRAVERGSSRPFQVNPGDVVVVTPRGASNWGRTWTGFTAVLSASRDIVNIALIEQVLNN